MNFKNIIGILLCLSSIPVFAQSITVKGKIFDNDTKEALKNANIQSSTEQTTSNSEGEFELKHSKVHDSIQISLIGYHSLKMLCSKNMLLALLPNEQELKTIVVTATREAGLRSESPMAISKLTSKLINETKALQVYEIINKTPGVIMPNYSNEQHAMSIRQPIGTNAYYLYMEDGIPIRPLGVFNHNALLEVNQYAISSIEVVKGPVSSIYGPEAVGGAINFIMQKPTLLPTVKFGVQMDQWGFRRAQFGAGAQIKKFGFYIAALSSQQKNSWLANSDYSKTAINARLEYHINEKNRLIGNFIYGKYDSQMSGSVDSTAFYSRKYTSPSDFTYRKSDAIRSRLTFEHDWNPQAKFFITVFQRFNKHGQNPSYAIRWNPMATPTNDPSKAKAEVNSNNFESYGFIFQHSQQFKFLNAKFILAGTVDLTNNDYWSHALDLNAQLDASGKFVNKYSIAKDRPDLPIANYNGFIKNIAGAIQYDFEPVKKLRFSLGSRYDMMDLDYHNRMNATNGTILYKKFTPKLGATYHLGNNKGFYINYAQGFSPPSLTAIFRPKPNSNPIAFYTNLKPAVFNNYEIGSWIELWDHKINIDISLYQMNGTNELLYIRQPDNSYDYQSAGRTLHRGIEFGLTVRPNSEFRFRFGGTTALHRFEDFQISTIGKNQNLGGFEMPAAPRWSWNSELSFDPNFLKNLHTSLEWQFISGWYQNQINTVRYTGYHLLNYRIAYTWKAIEIYSNIMNITNIIYANSASIGNNVNDRSTYNPGAPRTVVFGIQYQFTAKK